MSEHQHGLHSTSPAQRLLARVDLVEVAVNAVAHLRPGVDILQVHHGCPLLKLAPIDLDSEILPVPTWSIHFLGAAVKNARQ